MPGYDGAPSTPGATLWVFRGEPRLQTGYASKTLHTSILLPRGTLILPGRPDLTRA